MLLYSRFLQKFVWFFGLFLTFCGWFLLEHSMALIIMYCRVFFKSVFYFLINAAEGSKIGFFLIHELDRRIGIGFFNKNEWRHHLKITGKFRFCKKYDVYNPILAIKRARLQGMLRYP
jgi:hypothetical protein